MYILKYSEQVHMAKMHKLASASLPYEQVPNILRYTFNNLFIIYPLNGNFTIDSAPIYNIQDHLAFHFALVNVKTIISSTFAGYSAHPKLRPLARNCK